MTFKLFAFIYALQMLIFNSFGLQIRMNDDDGGYIYKCRVRFQT